MNEVLTLTLHKPMKSTTVVYIPVVAMYSTGSTFFILPSWPARTKHSSDSHGLSSVMRCTPIILTSFLRWVANLLLVCP